VLLVCLAPWSLAVGAASLPDAGQLLEGVRPAPLAPAKSPPLPSQEEGIRPAIRGVDAIRIPLRSVRISGATRFPVATLEALLADAIGHDLSLAELDALAQRITRYYRDHDIMLARAYIPAQDIVDGKVEFAVLEGRYGEIVVRNQSGLKDRAAQALVQPLAPDAVITGTAVRRVALLADDLAGVEAAATLRPGGKLGTSDYVLELRDGKARDGSLEFDNAGSRYSGRDRIGGSLAFDNLAGLGDRVSTRLLSSGKGLVYGQLGHALPLDYDGTDLALSYTQADYELGKEFTALDASGTARIAEIGLNRALVRSSPYNLRGHLGLVEKRLRDRSLGSNVYKRTRAVNLGLSGDSEADAGRMAFAASLTAGSLDIRPANVREFDDTTAGTQGGYAKLSLNAGLRRYLGSNNDLSLAYSGQLAADNLDSSEKMSLGGPYGVRAYPQAEASGDDAHLLRMELTHGLEPLPSGALELLWTLDYGVSRQVHRAWTGYTGANTRHLASMGVGLLWKGRGDWSLRADYAHRIGTEASVAEPDARARFWLDLVKLF
jgi:hemolysin activation/secretion protein